MKTFEEALWELNYSYVTKCWQDFLQGGTKKRRHKEEG
jgi:hypothetical protein